MKSLICLLALVLLAVGQAVAQECYGQESIRTTTVTCSCGQKVTVHACAYGTSGCFPAANWVQCGDCLVGDAKG